MVHIGKEAGEKEKESIRKESDILKKLNDENIVKYYGSTLKGEELWVSRLQITYCFFWQPFLSRSISPVTAAVS